MSVFADNVLAYLPGLAISNLITDCTALRVQPYCSRWNQILMLNCVQTFVVFATALRYRIFLGTAKTQIL